MDIFNLFDLEVLGTISAVFIGFLFSEHLKNYKEKKRGIVILERTIVRNHSILNTSKVFLDQWITSMSNNKIYKCKFSKLKVLSVEDTLLNKNLILINLLERENDFFLRCNEELVETMYASYEETKLMLVEKKIEENVWIEFQNNLTNQLTPYSKILENSSDSMLRIIAMIRIESNIQNKSIVGWFYNVFEKDIWPTFSEKKVEKELKKLKEETKKKSQK